MNYQTARQQLNVASHYYTPSAWQSLNSFLDDKVTFIEDNSLILHPVTLTKPELTQEGTISGVHYYAIRQSFKIPELKLIFETTAVVIGGTPQTLKIQSVNILKIPEM